MRFAGGVGTGFNQRTLTDLTARLSSAAHRRRVRSSRFHHASTRAMRSGCDPSCAATVEIAEFTNEGYVRHSSFTGLIE